MKRLGVVLSVGVGTAAACVVRPAAPEPLAAAPPTRRPASPVVVREPAPPAALPVEAEPVAVEPAPAGCWARIFGRPPRGEGRSFDAPVPGCPDCSELRAGPLATALHPEVVRRLRAVERGLPPPEIDEPRLWVNSGRREGSPGASMHNQGLAADVVVCGLDTRGVAERLREAGFACVIEYYDAEGQPCHMAHADLRGTSVAQDAYAPGGRKARTCPRRAVSRGESCANHAKADWDYAPPGAG